MILSDIARNSKNTEGLSHYMENILRQVKILNFFLFFLLTFYLQEDIIGFVVFDCLWLSSGVVWCRKAL